MSDAVDQETMALLIELGYDPDAPEDPNFVRWCGACSKDDHENCSHWCYCPCDFNK